MRQRMLVALSIAAAFALPLTVQAGGDKSASAGAGASGAEKMFQALDKNKDGFISRDEAKDTPHDKDFAKLDKNSDGKLTRQEHAAAPEHAGDKAASGGTASEGKSKY
jgi:Ca2+-binding EF-hand superfamily protein